MNITDKRIDNGKAFDWGRASEDYAKYRDIYPQDFYDRIINRGLCVKGQAVLDLGTGTGVLPRNMYKYGADWTGTDISDNQIKQAKKLAKEKHMDIDFITVPTEKIDFPDNTFDVITACQCFWYFNHETVIPNLARMLKPDGRLLILYMAWLPFEDEIAGKSEELVLKYNPDWSGKEETMRSIDIPECAYKYFELVHNEEYKINVPFTKESWNGRVKACRGVGASLSECEIAQWEQEHIKMLNNIAPNEFVIKHYVAMAELKLKY